MSSCGGGLFSSDGARVVAAEKKEAAGPSRSRVTNASHPFLCSSNQTDGRESSSRRLAAPLPDVARLHGPRPPISPGRFDAVLATVAISAAATNLASLPISFSPSPTQEASWYVGDLTLGASLYSLLPTSQISGASLGIFVHPCPKSGAKSMPVGGMMLCYSPVVRLFDGLILLVLCSRRLPRRERITSTTRRNGAPRRFGSLRR